MLYSTAVKIQFKFYASLLLTFFILIWSLLQVVLIFPCFAAFLLVPCGAQSLCQSRNSNWQAASFKLEGKTRLLFKLSSVTFQPLSSYLMSCNAHLRIGLGCFNSSIVELKKNVENYIWIFFLFSLIFAVKMLSFFYFYLFIFTRMLISVLALVFLLSQRTQINGKKVVLIWKTDV